MTTLDLEAIANAIYIARMAKADSIQEALRIVIREIVAYVVSTNEGGKFQMKDIVNFVSTTYTEGWEDNG